MSVAGVFSRLSRPVAVTKKGLSQHAIRAILGLRGMASRSGSEDNALTIVGSGNIAKMLAVKAQEAGVKTSVQSSRFKEEFQQDVAVADLTNDSLSRETITFGPLEKTPTGTIVNASLLGSSNDRHVSEKSAVSCQNGLKTKPGSMKMYVQVRGMNDSDTITGIHKEDDVIVVPFNKAWVVSDDIDVSTRKQLQRINIPLKLVDREQFLKDTYKKFGCNAWNYVCAMMFLESETNQPVLYEQAHRQPHKTRYEEFVKQSVEDIFRLGELDAASRDFNVTFTDNDFNDAMNYGKGTSHEPSTVGSLRAGRWVENLPAQFGNRFKELGMEVPASPLNSMAKAISHLNEDIKNANDISKQLFDELREVIK